MKDKDVEAIVEEFVSELYERALSITGASQYGDGTLEEQAYKHGFTDALAMVNIDISGTPKTKGMLPKLIAQAEARGREEVEKERRFLDVCHDYRTKEQFEMFIDARQQDITAIESSIKDAKRKLQAL